METQTSKQKEFFDNLIQRDDCTKHEDGSYSFKGSVNISALELTRIPIKFRSVGGWFSCRYNKLTSLEGCPKTAGKWFSCSFNQLTSLEGCPKIINGWFFCEYNQ